MEDGFLNVDEWIDDLRGKNLEQEKQREMAEWYLRLRARGDSVPCYRFLYCN